MKTLWLVLLIAGAMLAAIPTPSSAQGNSNSGTSAEGMGSTGWTGPNRGQSGTASAGQNIPANPEAAMNQPWTATGKDLNGPAQRFPAGQTPE